jgi:sucrose-6-phosphate hydrolase SacC (GH32 family)
MHNQLLTILRDCWQFSSSLNKFKFQWHLTPANLTILAATDNSGIVKFHGIKYHVQYQHNTDLINITRT